MGDMPVHVKLSDKWTPNSFNGKPFLWESYQPVEVPVEMGNTAKKVMHISLLFLLLRTIHLTTINWLQNCVK